MAKVEEIKETLKNCDLFETLTDHQLISLIRNARGRRFPPEATVYAKGENNDGRFGMIVSGRVWDLAENALVVKKTGASEMIGEFAIINPKGTRTGSMVTEGTADILEWRCGQIEENDPDLMKKLEDLVWEKINYLKEALQKCKFFETLTEKELHDLIRNAHFRKIAEDETIYEKGESADGTFGMIVSGRLGVCAETGQVVKEISGNEIIGEIGLTSPQGKRSVSVKTMEDTEFMEWNYDRIESRVPDLLKKLKELAWKNISYYS